MPRGGASGLLGRCHGHRRRRSRSSNQNNDVALAIQSKIRAPGPGCLSASIRSRGTNGGSHDIGGLAEYVRRQTDPARSSKEFSWGLLRLDGVSGLWGVLVTRRGCAAVRSAGGRAGRESGQLCFARIRIAAGHTPVLVRHRVPDIRGVPLVGILPREGADPATHSFSTSRGPGIARSWNVGRAVASPAWHAASNTTR
jgi:hypothetical protein